MFYRIFNAVSNPAPSGCFAHSSPTYTTFEPTLLNLYNIWCSHLYNPPLLTHSIMNEMKSYNIHIKIFYATKHHRLEICIRRSQWLLFYFNVATSCCCVAIGPRLQHTYTHTNTHRYRVTNITAARVAKEKAMFFYNFCILL